MFVQFFREASLRTRFGAWGGLLVVMSYSAFAAWTKMRVNEFYNEFYDLLQHRVVEHTGNESASGEVATDEDDLASLRAEVWRQLSGFAQIVVPLIVAAPVSKWVRAAWAFAWRVALMRSYLDAWDVALDPIEGASQRLHEDTQRFCNALQGCLATLLDAVFTLFVFAPILVDLGRTIAPPIDVGPLRGGWLLALAYLAATVGLGGAMLAGSRLVTLEVNNQRVEASLRRDLVVLETAPEALFGTSAEDADRGARSRSPPDSPRTGRPRVRGAACASPLLFFSLTLKRLWSNYHALFRNFAALNLWLTFFDQVMVLFPYVVAGPLLFADDPAARITLGTLVKLSNSFDKVFGSLSVVAENYGAVNEWRSVVRRLREFETRLFAQPPLPRDAPRAGPGGRARSIVYHTSFRGDPHELVDGLPSATAPLPPPATAPAPARGGRGAQQRAEEALRSRGASPADCGDGGAASVELVEAELSESALSNESATRPLRV